MKKILIVDDSTVMRKKLAEILTQAGYEIVAEAWNGEQAYREYAKWIPDLVTMDITMPNMDGINAVKKIIGDFPDAKIIMVSALQQKSMILSSLRYGARHYIIKPFKVDDVLKIVNTVISDTSAPNAKISDIHGKLDESDTKNDTGILPFSIENNSGEFVVNIKGVLNNSSFDTLDMMVKALMPVKPLKVLVDFNYSDYIDDSVLSRIDNLAQCIQNIGGMIRFVSKSERFMNSIQNKNIGFKVHPYFF